MPNEKYYIKNEVADATGILKDGNFLVLIGSKYAEINRENKRSKVINAKSS